MDESIRSKNKRYRVYGKLNLSDLKHMAITSIVFGFILSFRKWGGETFDASMGLQNFVIYSAISMLAFLSMSFGIRYAAVQMGLVARYRSWATGLGMSLIGCIISYGFPILLTPGGFDLSHHKGLEQGLMFQGPVRKHKAVVAFWGTFTLVTAAIIIKSLSFISNEFRNQMVFVFLIIGTFNLIPVEIIFSSWQDKIPNTLGSTLLGATLNYFFFTWIFLIIAWIFIWFAGFKTLIIGIIVAFIFFIYTELFWRPGNVRKRHEG